MRSKEARVSSPLFLAHFCFFLGAGFFFGVFLFILESIARSLDKERDRIIKLARCRPITANTRVKPRIM
jgi:hypothetical protein